MLSIQGQAGTSKENVHINSVVHRQAKAVIPVPCTATSPTSDASWSPAASAFATSLLWEGPLGAVRAAGAPVLVHGGAGHHRDGWRLIGQRAAALLMWREHHDNEALAAAVAVRRAVKGAAAAHRRQRLRRTSGAV